MKHYLESSSEVFGEVKSTENGLTSEQARRRSAETGKNKLAEGKKTPLILRFLSQFADPMIIILIAAAVISAITSVLQNASPPAAPLIMFVVIGEQGRKGHSGPSKNGRRNNKGFARRQGMRNTE